MFGRSHELIWKSDRPSSRKKSLRIFTDASMDSSNVGISFVACEGDYVIKEMTGSLKEISVYRAEMMAIKDALSWIKTEDLKQWSLDIYNDCLSAVTTLNGTVALDPLTGA